MAYFPNGTAGECLDDQCFSCIHGMNDSIMCPVKLVQTHYNYDQLNEGNEDLRAAIDLLVDEKGECQMKTVMEKVGLTFDCSAREQMPLELT